MARINPMEEIEAEKAIEADEVRILQEAIGLLNNAFQQLAVTEEESSKERTASMQAFQALAYQMAGHFAQASIEIGSAITKLKNSFADEEKIRRLAEDAANKAKRDKNIRLNIIETNALNATKSHGSIINYMIKELSQIRNELDSVRNIQKDSFGKNYHNLEKIRKNSTSVLKKVIEKLNGYIITINNIYRILNFAEGKKPWWKPW